ncbi:MAG: hypothetical protein AAB869_02330 [Patescibacteria group bacterium]
MEHPDFTERDRERLRQLQSIADETLEKALGDPKLKRWKQLLYGVGLGAFCCIFFLPTGRGVTSWINYPFFLLFVLTLALFFLVLRWKRDIQERVEGEFLGGRHGVEYKALTIRRNFAEKNPIRHD